MDWIFFLYFYLFILYVLYLWCKSGTANQHVNVIISVIMIWGCFAASGPQFGIIEGKVTVNVDQIRSHQMAN